MFKTIFKFSWFILCLFLNGMVLAGGLTQEDLKPLLGDDFGAKQKVVNVIFQAPPEQASTILFALQEENLFGGPNNILIIKAGDSYKDVINGNLISVKESELVQLNLNNALRSEIDAAASQFKLLSNDSNERLQSIKSLLEDYGSVKLELVQKAYLKEKDPSIKAQVSTLLAMVQYEGANDDLKRSSINILGQSSSQNAEAFLNNLIKQNDKGEFIEKNSDLRIAAELALKSYKSRKSHAEIVSNIFTGLSLGSVLLLAALGLAITYGLIGVINMAHGEFLMVGAYATFMTQTFFRSNFPELVDFYLIFAVPFSFLCAGAVGLLLENLVLKYLYGRPLETLLATFGVSLLMMQFVRFIFGAQNVEVANPTWMSGSFSPLQNYLPGLLIPYNRLIIFCFALFVVFVTWVVLNKTRMGLFVRAVTQNRSMASCVGVKTRKVDSYAFAFGAGVAGLGGCALSQIGNVGPDLGQSYIIDSFMAVVLGGVGQLAGTIVGAFGLGILSKFSEPFIGAVLTKISVLVIIIFFIQKRPQGIFALKGRSAES